MGARAGDPNVEVMNPNPTLPSSVTSSRFRLGLPFLAVVGLALLAVPRVVLHDLRIVTEAQPLNLLLVFVPLVVWIAVVLATRVPNPFLTLTVVGVCYGVLLVVVHQLLWTSAFAGALPQLGGNLTSLDPATSQLVVRLASVVSSLFTGTIVGAVCGVVATAIAAIRSRRGGKAA